MIADGAVSTLFPLGVDLSTRWFSAHGCVAYETEKVSVYVGGSLIGSYEPGDRGTRNVILVGLARDPRAHLGKMAAAFDVVPETLRQIRAQAETDGLEAVLHRAPGGREAKLTPAIRRKLEKLFEEGVSISKAHALIAKRHDISRTLVANVRKQWAAAKTPTTRAETEPADGAGAPSTLSRMLAQAPAISTVDESAAMAPTGMSRRLLNFAAAAAAR